MKENIITRKEKGRMGTIQNIEEIQITYLKKIQKIKRQEFKQTL